MGEADEVYRRLNVCEQDLHTLKHRTNVLEGERLAHRVTNLEASVSQVTKDVGKIESKVCEITDQVRSMRSTSRGVLLALTALVTLVQLLPFLRELLK